MKCDNCGEPATKHRSVAKCDGDAYVVAFACDNCNRGDGWRELEPRVHMPPAPMTTAKKKAAAVPKVQALFYIQDTRTIVGNSMSWWAIDHAGYTCDIRKAHVWTEKELNDRFPGELPEHLRIWPLEYIDERVSHHIDTQHCRIEQAAKRLMIGRVLRSFQMIPEDALERVIEILYEQEDFDTPLNEMTNSPSASVRDAYDRLVREGTKIVATLRAARWAPKTEE